MQSSMAIGKALLQWLKDGSGERQKMMRQRVDVDDLVGSYPSKSRMSQRLNMDSVGSFNYN